MTKGVLVAIMILALFGLMGASSLTFAPHGNILRLQGIIMALDAKNQMIVVNERVFLWDRHTAFFNEKGAGVPIERMKSKQWVYIEADQDKRLKKAILRKVYLLPKYIDHTERDRYRFLQENGS